MLFDWRTCQAVGYSYQSACGQGDLSVEHEVFNVHFIDIRLSLALNQNTICTGLIDRLQVVPFTRSGGLKQDWEDEPRKDWTRFTPSCPLG